MSVKKFTGAPFGIQQSRFDVAGMHPKCKVPGTFIELPYNDRYLEDSCRRLGPGRYELSTDLFSAKAMEEKCKGPGWARAYEVERMAALPHLLHKEQWEQKRMLAKKLGPGSYEIKDLILIDKPGSTRGICAGRAPRFHKENPNGYPGPGTYGVGGIPHTILEEKATRSTSTRGMIEAASATSRYFPTVGSGLGPGTYSFKDSTELMLKKVTSLKGPYETFTLDRNKPVNCGHFAAPKRADLAPGQYETSSFITDLYTGFKKHHGKFGKIDQYPDYLYRIPDGPGPGAYNPKEVVSHTVNQNPKLGFLTSSQRSDKFSSKGLNTVGAGRYDVQKWDESQERNGHSSAFRSRSEQFPQKRTKFLNERIRAKDVRFEDRVFLVKPEIPPRTSKSETHYMAYRAATVA